MASIVTGVLLIVVGWIYLLATSVQGAFLDAHRRRVHRVAGCDQAFDLAIPPWIGVEVDLVVRVLPEDIALRELLAYARPGAHRADLAQVEQRSHGEDHGMDHTHTAHADDGGIEPAVVLLEMIFGVAHPVDVTIGQTVAGLDPIDRTACRDDIQRSHQVR